MVESIGFVVLPLVCGIVVFLFGKPHRETPHDQTRDNAFQLFFLIFICLYVIGFSSGASEYEFLTIIESEKLICAIFAMVAGYTLLRYIGARSLSRIIAFSGLAPSLYGFFLLLGRSGGEYSGMTGTFGLHNPFAGFLLMTIPFAIYALHESRNTRFLRLFWTFVVIVEIAAFIMTKSRAAHIVTLLILLIAALLIMPKFKASIKTMRVFAWTLVSASFAFVTVVPYILYTYFQPLFRELDFSLKGRIIFWESGLRIFLDNPIFGTGLGTFANTYPRYQPDFIYYSTDPHSFILSIMTGTGSIGVLLLIMFLALIIRLATMNIVSDKTRLSMALSLAVLGSMLHSTVDFDMTVTANLWLFSAMCSMLLYCSQELSRHGVSGSKNEPGSDKILGNHARILKESANKIGHFRALGGMALFVCILWLIGGYPMFNYEARTGNQNRVSDTALKSGSPYLPFYVRRLNEIASSNISQEERELALNDLRDRLNKHEKDLSKVAGFYYLRALIGNYPAPYVAAIDISTAISLDPHNRPEYYFSLVEYYRKNEQPNEAYRTLKSFLLDAIPIDEPIMPNHYRPTWMPMNREFGKMWGYLADYEKEYGNAELAAKYAATSRKFIEYADANGL